MRTSLAEFDDGLSNRRARVNICAQAYGDTRVLFAVAKGKTECGRPAGAGRQHIEFDLPPNRTDAIENMMEISIERVVKLNPLSRTHREPGGHHGVAFYQFQYRSQRGLLRVSEGSKSVGASLANQMLTPQR